MARRGPAPVVPESRPGTAPAAGLPATATLVAPDRSAAHELGPYGITANLVRPPATDTGWVTPEAEAAALASGPLRHLAQPSDVAEVVTFLASHQARYVTAQLVQMR